MCIRDRLYVYYNLFISPHAISLQQSAEVLLMAILGGASTLTGPIVGAVVITIMFMPFGIVPGVRQLWARMSGAKKPERAT